MPLHKSSRPRLDPTMISAPLGDFRHTMHIGRGGDAFGDTSFLSTVGPGPASPELGSPGILPAAEPQVAINHNDLYTQPPGSPQSNELHQSESVSSLTLDLDLDLDLGPSMLGDVLGVMDGLGLDSNEDNLCSTKNDKSAVELKQEKAGMEMSVSKQNELNGKNLVGLDGNQVSDNRIPDGNGIKLKGLKPKVRFSDKREEIIRQASEEEEGQGFDLQDESQQVYHSPTRGESNVGAGDNEFSNKADLPPSPSSSHSSEYEGVTPLDRRRVDVCDSETDSGEEEEEEGVEIESFEVTDWDLANEFNPDRRRYRQTKEQATYGIWAEKDSDEDERPSFGGKRSKDYTAPVSFVSAGLRKTAAEEKLQQKGDDRSDDSDEDAPSAPPTTRGTAPKKLQMGKFRGNQSQRFAGGIQSGQGIGSWEKHTKGIGQKLLQKMGYQPGQGLGKNAQGIVNPIEAKVRKGKGAVGAYGNERTQQSLQDFPVVDSDEEEEKEFQKELGQWRKDPAGLVGKKKPKYSYRTVDELKAKGKLAGRSTAASAGELAQVKVIDMTGREQKVYYSYSQMTNKHSVPDEGPPSMSARDQKGSGFALPELEHNLQLLIDLTEQDILQSARRLQHEKDVVVSLSHESRALQSRLNTEQDAIQRMEAVLALVDRFPSGETAPGEGPTLQECARIFETLQSDYYEEYKTMGLADLAVAVVHPLLKEKLHCWDPLKDSSYCLEDIGQWRAILESRDLHSSAPDSNMDPYHRVLWEVWIPVMRCCVSAWQPRILGPMVDCVEMWSPLLPVWILDHLLEQLILPRLQREVDTWNPLTDTVPIHSWIHPWLPLLQTRLEPLYPPIRSKLSNALQRWHPSDASARLILQPWKDVFTPGAWEAFMVKNIIPKLALCLEELVINPHQQQMEPFHWVMDWEGMLSPSSLVSLLDKNFFTKWLQVLCSWLSNSPNYEEITKWYLGWKSMFSDVLLAQPLIKEKFNEALDIMNRAVSSGIGGYMQPGARENIAYLTQTERRKDFQYEAMQERRDAESVAHRGISAGVPTNFKDLIQTKAEENNIVFMPLVAKRHEGKQLYTFGRIVIYIDRGVVFVQGEKTWVPTSLQSLIDMAK